MERKVSKIYTPQSEVKAWSALPFAASLAISVGSFITDMLMVAVIALPVGIIASLVLMSSALSNGALKQYLNDHPIKHDPDCIDCLILGQSARCEIDSEYYDRAKSLIPKAKTSSVLKALLTGRSLTWQVHNETLNKNGDTVNHHISIKGTKIVMEETHNVSEISLWNEALQNAVLLK